MPDTALFWFVFAVLVAMAEVFSGTFYLLAVALGLAGVGTMLALGLGLSAGLALGAGLMLLGVAGVWRWRQRSALTPPAAMDLDLGAEVALVSYQAGNPHHGRVRYRGCEWDARLSFTGSPPPVGSLGEITGHQANCLQVSLRSAESGPST